MIKLSWNPPKWKSYTLQGDKFQVELETGEVYVGNLVGNFIDMSPVHSDVCYKIFGQHFTSRYKNEVAELSRVLDLPVSSGNWPEYYDIKKFLKRYYERVAKIEDSFTQSIISIESEIDITPKFTL